MPYISQASIQEVKDRLDAIALVSDYVHLEKRAGRWWGCCPFHQEKTASFTVNADLKTYYCFGCHKGGTVINFVMEMDKLTFPEAIDLLAKRFGVELVYENSGGTNYSAEDEAKKKEKDALFDLYQRITGVFHHFLLKKAEAEAAKLYIISRGLNIDMIERFRLGYAPADRYWLYKFLSQKGYSREFLGMSGLFSSRYPEVSFFSGRLMFPIADRQGRTVAFGGRYLPGPSVQTAGRSGTDRKAAEPPKYINSPELGIYKKGETLFAADLALPEIRRTKTAYIAEGYMDVIALHQAGITNALAPLGTAFTDDQAKLLRRWAEKVILFFDSDGAGQAAAVKGIFTCRKNGLDCAIVTPDLADPADTLRYGGPEAPPQGKNPGSNESPQGIPKDPADILNYYGPEALQKKAKCFITDFDYLMTRARALYTSSGSAGSPAGGVSGQRPSVQGKARAIAFLFPYLDLLDSEVARDTCIETLADTFGLLPAVVADDYRAYISGQRSPGRTAEIKKEETNSRQSGVGNVSSIIRMNDELSLLIVVAVDYVSPRPPSGAGAEAPLREEKLFPKFRTALEINEIEDPNAKEIFIALEECIRYGETSMDELLVRITSPELKEFIVERSATGEFSLNTEQLVTDGIRKIKERRLEHQQEEIIVKLRGLKGTAAGTSSSGEADRSSEANGLDVRELLAEKMRIDNELYLLKQGR